MSTRADGAISRKLELPLSSDTEGWLKSTIRDIPDFPKPGIVFKDVTTLLRDPEAYSFTLEALAARASAHSPDCIVGIEARGFIVGSAVAHLLGVGFVPIRKPGKLPYKVEQVSYDLEYGSDMIEIHVDAVTKGEKVVLLDDLLATGGTASGAIKLIEKLGARVAAVGFIVELGFLDGRKKLEGADDVFSLLSY